MFIKNGFYLHKIKITNLKFYKYLWIFISFFIMFLSFKSLNNYFNPWY